MDRRALLAALGTAGLGALAGCGGSLRRRFLDSGPPPGCGVPPSFDANRGDLPPDDTPTDGLPPVVDGSPPSREVDPASFPHDTVHGAQIRLAPVDVAHYWWERGAARFADARDRSAYDRAHVYGAVRSPAPDVADGGCDPVIDWPKRDRVVCYDGRTHSLAARRAAALLDAGHTEVYALAGGVHAWVARDYPVAGTAVD